MERLEMDNVDDFSEDLGAETVRLSSAMVGFVVGFGAKTVRGWSQCRNGWCSSSLTSISPLGRCCALASWIEVAFPWIGVLACGLEWLSLWLCLLVDIGYLTGKPMELADVVLVCDWWFFILFVIGDFVWSGLRKKIGDLDWWCFFFFFSSLLWTGGGGRCGCGCGWW